MTQVCRSCAHPRHRELDAALLAGENRLRRIAMDFGLSEASLRRHRAHCLHDAVLAHQELRRMLDANNLLDKLAELDDATREMLDEARRGGDLRTALAAVRESRENINAYSRLGVVSDLERRVELLETGESGESSTPADDDQDRERGA